MTDWLAILLHCESTDADLSLTYVPDQL